MKKQPESYLWEEKYRPKEFNDCILPKDIKNTFEKFIDEEYLPHLILEGTPGIGKTTMLNILADYLEMEFVVWNGSHHNGIDFIRNNLEKYMMTSSMNGNRKLFVLEEADRLTTDALQAMKMPFEQYSDNCSVIMTTNNYNTLVQKCGDDAILSRMDRINFNYTSTQIEEIAFPSVKRIYSILKEENIEFDQKNKSLQSFIVNTLPDFRSVLKLLRRHIIENNNSVTDKIIDCIPKKLDKDLIMKIIYSTHEEISSFSETLSSTKIFSYIGKNILDFTKDINTITRIYNALTHHENLDKMNVLKINNMISFYYNLRQIFEAEKRK